MQQKRLRPPAAPSLLQREIIREESEIGDHQAEINQKAFKRPDTGPAFLAASLYHLKSPCVSRCCTGYTSRKPTLNLDVCSFYKTAKEEAEMSSLVS